MFMLKFTNLIRVERCSLEEHIDRIERHLNAS